MLSRAFGDDDMKDIFPDLEERKVKIPHVNEFLLRRNYSNARAFITSLQLEGIAVWIPSHKIGKIPFWRILTSGAVWPAIKIGFKA